MRSLTTILILSILTNGSLPSLTFAKEAHHYLMAVKFSERKLILLEINEGGISQEIRSYPVAVPSKDYYPLPLFGKIKRIELNPYWYPTAKTRNAYKKEKGVDLPKVIKPGDPRNAMGAAKFVIQFENWNEPIRIHGTNDPKSIGRRVTRGCLRLKNQDILEIAKIVRGKKVLVRIEK